MRVLFLGDIVGRSAREAIVDQMPRLRTELDLDFVVVNGENAAGGFGITKAICEELYDCGVDVITLGNHAWDQREAMIHVDQETRLIRPRNFPQGTPGRGSCLYQTEKGQQVLVINAMGRVFMDALDCPFASVGEALDETPLGDIADFVLVDFHAEATSEKMAMGHFCDGRASLVVGTHSHVPTADAQIFNDGTAYQTDAGMCGDYDSVIGMDKNEPVNRFQTKISSGRFSPALGPATLCGVLVETDPVTGLATSIEPFRRGGRLKSATPAKASKSGTA